MIKLTEVVALPAQYDPELGKNDVEYKLRDIFVNPTHVVTMRDDEDYNRKMQVQQLVKGLSKEVTFTRLNLNMGSNVSLKCTVTGSPDSVMAKIMQKSG